MPVAGAGMTASSISFAKEIIASQSAAVSGLGAAGISMAAIIISFSRAASLTESG